MAYVNAKEGTGVRARGDLSPNLRSASDRSKPLTSTQLHHAAEHLNGLIALAEKRDHATHIVVSLSGAKRLVDALLLAAHMPVETG